MVLGERQRSVGIRGGKACSLSSGGRTGCRQAVLTAQGSLRYSGLHVYFTEDSSPLAQVTIMLVTFSTVTSWGNMGHCGGDPCTPAVLFELLPVISSDCYSWSAAHDKQLWLCTNCSVWDGVLVTLSGHVRSEWSHRNPCSYSFSFLLSFTPFRLLFPPWHTYGEQWRNQKVKEVKSGWLGGIFD